VKLAVQDLYVVGVEQELELPSCCINDASGIARSSQGKVFDTAIIHSIYPISRPSCERRTSCIPSRPKRPKRAKRTKSGQVALPSWPPFRFQVSSLSIKPCFDLRFPKRRSPPLFECSRLSDVYTSVARRSRPLT